MANQFLVKETVDAMRDLSADEIDGLQGSNPTYAGVQLLGYYEKGDTPAPIEYYLSDTTEIEDGFSVFEIGGIKLKHDFGTVIPDLSYTGVNSPNLTSQETIIKLQSIIDIPWVKEINFTPNYIYTIDATQRGSEGSQRFGIRPKSNMTLYFNNCTIRQIPTDKGTYYILDLAFTKNVKIFDINIIGDRDTHLTPNGATYKQRRSSTSFSTGEYLSIQGKGFLVTQSGVTGASEPTVSSLTIGGTLTDGTVVMRMEYDVLGEFGIGVRHVYCDNVQIENANIKDCWGDGIALSQNFSGLPENTNRNIYWDNIQISNCRRQGISIVDCGGLLANNISIDTVMGTSPQAGIDFEPNAATDVLSNIKINNLKTKKSQGGGIIFVFTNMTSPDALVDVEINNYISESDVSRGVRNSGKQASQLKGSIRMNNVSVINSTGFGIQCDNYRNKPDFIVEGLSIINPNTSGLTGRYSTAISIITEGSALSDVDMSPITLNNVNIISENGAIANLLVCNNYNNTDEIMKNINISFNHINSLNRLIVYSGENELKFSVPKIINRSTAQSSSKNNTYDYITNTGASAEVAVTLGAYNTPYKKVRLYNTNGTRLSTKFSTGGINGIIASGLITRLFSDTVGDYVDLKLIDVANSIWKIDKKVGNWRYEDLSANIFYLGQASLDNFGTLKVSTAVPINTATLPTSDTASVATDIEGLKTDLNDLITKYNILLTALTSTRNTLNNKLLADRASGQQANE